MDSSGAWNSHNWQVRKVENKGVIHHHCSRCSRDFVDDPSSGKRHAVYVSVFSFHELPELITTRWMDEFCPGKPLFQDIAARKRIDAGNPKAERGTPGAAQPGRTQAPADA
jgi:hypothetical protein